MKNRYTGPVRMLTVRQPWAWAIIHAGKDVENRSRRTLHRGLLVIHAGLKVEPAGVDFIQALGISVPTEAFQGGTIQGAVNLIDCVRDAESVWAAKGQWHWVVSDPTPAVSAVLCKGQLAVVDPPKGWESAFA